MASSPKNLEVAHDFFPFFRVSTDGRVHRLITPTIVPAADDPQSNFRSKDVTISLEPHISARIFIPSSATAAADGAVPRLPLLFYVHGGAFCIESAFSSQYHTHVGSLAARAHAVAVSVEYRLAPEHPLPACYDDCWAALKWVAAHANRGGAEPWLNDFADFGRICLAGDSAGANICHYLASRAGSEDLGEAKVGGMALIHPFFGDGAENRLWKYLCPGTNVEDDPRLRPAAEDLGKLGCRRVAVFVAEEDFLKEGARRYDEELRRSGWGGAAETVEHGGVGHVFHLLKPECEKADDLMHKLASFIKLVD